MKFVCNTSPLIFLGKISRLNLLTRLYGEGIIPASVVAEIRAKRTKEAQEIEELWHGPHFRVREASRTVLEDLPSELGAGEREAIGLALELHTDLLVLDDQEGRRIARAKGIPITGTIGVLGQAREQGLIPAISPELDRLIEEGIWISKAFYDQILREFGE